MSNESTADLCQLDYVAQKDMTYQALLYYRNDGQLFKELNKLGYNVYQASSEPNYLNSLYDLTEMRQEEMLFKSTTMEGRTQLDLCIDRTPISLFDFDFLQYTTNAKKMRISRVYDYFNDEKNYTYGESVALFSHIMCPHSPFVYAADGSTNPSEGFYNWADKQYYLGQYIYTMNKTKEMVEKLIENDPNCIIIIQSDHGPRTRSDDRVEMPFNFEESEMIGIFNAVYVGGEKLDIEGLTGVNTLRAVLEKMGADTPQIDNEPSVIPYPYLEKLNKNNDVD